MPNVGIMRYLVNVVDDTRARMRPEQRREMVLGVASDVFGARGYHGATTDQIARAAGISQPYVVRMFGSKEALFVEVVRHCLAQLLEGFRAALAELGDRPAVAEVVSALAEAYLELARTRGVVHLSLMQSFLLGADPVIGEAARHGFLQMWDFLRHEAGLDVEQAHRFAEQGMMINTLLGLRMDFTDLDRAGAREIVDNTSAGLGAQHEGQHRS